MLTFESWAFHINLPTGHRAHEISTANTMDHHGFPRVEAVIMSVSYITYLIIFVCSLDWNTPGKWWFITMQLKRFVPFSVHSKDKVTKKDSQRIQQYVWSFAHRWSHKADLKGILAKLAAKVNKRRRWTHEERKRRGQNAVFHSVFQIHICKLFSPIEFNDQRIIS